MKIRIGIDAGGTKISGVALGAEGEVLAKLRVPAPRQDYKATIDTISSLTRTLAGECVQEGQPKPTIGVGIPGSISRTQGTVQNANSTWLNGRELPHDLSGALGQPVRIANDANCFALSEAFDGAAAGEASVFGVIIGTGCGGGLVHGGRLIAGHRRIGGEWGHTPLPTPEPDEQPGPLCWCGRRGCIETWVSGPGLAADFARSSGERLGDQPAHAIGLAADEIADLANQGNEHARQALDRHADRLARGLAMVINCFDPAVIVLGGGLSNLEHLYLDLPMRIAPRIFADDQSIDIRRPAHGDDSGVRGAARLWDE